MNIAIVADDKMSTVARKMVQAISMMPGYSASYWTTKHYKDSEATIAGKQRVVFLGENELSKSYKEILKIKFQAYGTTCYHEGTKVLLVVDEKKTRNKDEIESFRSVMKNKRAELVKKYDSNKISNTQIIRTVIGVLSGFFTILATGLGAAMLFAMIYKNYASEYANLQYEYLSLRFMDEVFPSFVE